MSQNLHRFTVNRYPSSAPAKNSVGYKPTPFRVIAASESQALEKARSMSAYRPEEFGWRVVDVEELTPAEKGAV